MSNLFFKSPFFLLLLLLIPIFLWLHYKHKKNPGLNFPTIYHLKEVPYSLKSKLQPLLPILRACTLALLILALARPQLGVYRERVTEKGIDIILAVDVSTSMLAEDFSINNQRLNRLDVLKKVLEDFIPKRPNDRLGMVVFAGRPYTVAPLTWDQEWLIQRLSEVKIGMIEDGTAIGSAIMTSVNRLKDSKAKSKVLILLTDGNNNRGIEPADTAEVAKALGIKIYTIGAGSRGVVPYPATDPFGNKVYQRVKIDIDDTLLTKIAEATGGRYYRATDTTELYRIYDEIDKLEKSAIEMTQFYRYKELYPRFILLTLLVILLEIFLQHTVMRRLP